VPVYPKRWFREILARMPDESRVVVVRLADLPAAAGILIGFNDMIEVPWASSLRSMDRLGANMFLYWNLLKYSADAGYGQFDFGRSTEGSGTFRFKKQWGARPAQLNWRDYESGGAFMEVDGRSGGARAFAATIWKFLPLPVANAIGPRIRKFISL